MQLDAFEEEYSAGEGQLDEVSGAFTAEAIIMHIHVCSRVYV